MFDDLRVACRGLIKRPGFTSLALLTLALGIGASGAVFSLLDALYFRPLPLREPDRLARITRPSPKTVYGLLSYPEFRELSASSPAFSNVVAIGGRGVTLHEQGETSMLLVKYVSPEFFDTVGIPMSRGRGLRAGDERSETPLVVINHQLWQTRLAGRPDVVGRTIRLNDAFFTVVGVTSRDFVGLDRVVRSDVFILAEHARFAVKGLGNELVDRSSRWFEVYARLAPGASLEQARAHLDALSARWAADNASDYAGAGLRVAAFNDEYRGGVAQGAVFLGLVVLVLLVACANAANLTLARNEGRRRELAVRVALGASRGQMARQLFAESLLLSTGGVIAGLALARGLMGLLAALASPGSDAYVVDARFDARLVAFTGLLMAISTALVAIVPAWRHSRPDLVPDLKQGQATRTTGWTAREWIVVSQMAATVVVLIAAGLLSRSLLHSARIDAGFDPAKNVATFYAVPALRGYDDAASARFFEGARRRALSLPGVTRASYAIRLPAQANESGWAADFFIPGVAPPPGEDAFQIRYGIVGPDYFETIGARLIKGRGVRETDGPESPRVAIVNRTFAERMWPGEDPIGKRVVMGRKQRIEREVVGVAENGRIADLSESPEPYAFVPFAQMPQGFALLLVETSGRAESLFGPVRGAIREMDAEMAVLETSTLADHRASVLFEQSRDAKIGAGVGLLGLLLGMVGLYGVISLVAVARTKEIGVRMALGARRSDVLALVLGRGVRLAATGALLGALAGLAAARVLAS
ncbi:MAG: ADOP family duplicated permease, partial [Vicinamibacteria bacterium]|nr:ADOP family duplicated permease [Vicinamibacteria bacterium]